MAILQNILSFIGTFIVISSGSILAINKLAGIISNNYKSKDYVDYRIIIIGIIIASVLIPLYYFPNN
jgi:hypothetical protein